MIIYFISALLISLVLYKLGSYSTLIYFFVTGGKVALAVFLLIIFYLAVKKFTREKSLKLPFRR